MPVLATALVAGYRRGASGFWLRLGDTRRAIDAPVFEYLGLTPGEQDGASGDLIVGLRD